MRQRGATEQNAIRSDEAIFPNIDWLGGLPARRKINTVCNELGSKSPNCSKRPNPHPRRAIYQVPAAYPGVSFNHQLRPSIRLVRKMPARSRGKPGNPIQLPNNRMRTQMEQIDILANG